jgi:hypothetical protein
VKLLVEGLPGDVAPINRLVESAAIWLSAVVLQWAVGSDRLSYRSMVSAVVDRLRLLMLLVFEFQ